MDLAGYTAQVKALLGSGPDPAAWTATLIGQALLEALREYDEVGPIERGVFVARAGYVQDFGLVGFTLGGVAGMLDGPNVHRVIGVALPWEEGNWLEYALQPISVVGSLVVWHPGYEASEGEHGLVLFKRRHVICGLNSALIVGGAPEGGGPPAPDSYAATTVEAEYENLIVLGAAAWAVAIRSRELSGLVEPDEPSVRAMRTWSELRLAEFRNGLARIAGRGLRQPVWGDVGL